MESTLVRVSKPTRALLRLMAKRSGCSMQEVLDRAVEEYRRRRFLEEVNAGYAALGRDAAGASLAAEEIAAWNDTLQDGLDPQESWDTEGKPIPKRKPRRKKNG